MAYIIIVGPAHPFRGGIAISTESLARTWQNMGHQVEVVTFTTQYPAFLFPGKSQFAGGPAPKDLSIKRKLSSINPLSWFLVGHALKRKKPDVILLRYWLPFMAPSLGTVARIAQQNKHSKVIALADNIVPHEHRTGDQQLTQYFVNSCQAFVTMSDTVTQDLRTFDKAKPVICQPHPIYDTYGAKIKKQEARQLLGLDASAPYILFFGFIRHYKGLDLLLRAMKDERLLQANVKLIIAGEYYEPEEPYQALINSEKLKGRVMQFPEFIPHEKVAVYFSAADLVVQPYRRATQSGVTQIAYHFEKPMVVTNVGGLPEMVPDQEVGFVVAVEPPAIADAIFTYFQNNLEEAMVANIREEKKKFTWERLAEAILHLKSQVNQ